MYTKLYSSFCNILLFHIYRFSQIERSSPTSCLGNSYPYVNGGHNDGDSYFNSMDMDTPGNIILGGVSSSTTLLTPGLMPNPYFVYYSYIGEIVWTL